MENKNFNTGQISTEGGPVHIGDIKYTIDGLAFLLQDFSDQLRHIESLIRSFKPRTALGLLERLEEKIATIEAHKNDKVTAKLLFLKALCKKDLDRGHYKIFSRDFLRAYQLDREDIKLKNHALISYTNLGENEKAIALADSIIEYDEYNTNAWLCRLVMSGNVGDFIKGVPKPVLENNGFQISVMYHLMGKKDLDYSKGMEDYGLDWKIDLGSYKELRYENWDAWAAAIDIKLNEFGMKSSLKQIKEEENLLEETPEVSALLRVMAIYIDTLKETEVGTTIGHQKFFFNYIKFLLTNEDKYYTALIETYGSSIEHNWPQTMSICQILIRKKRFAESIECLLAYKDARGEINDDYYSLKFITHHLEKDEAKSKETFDSYLPTIVIINELNGFNILSTFLHVLYPFIGRENLDAYILKLNSKQFVSPQLKELFQVSIQIRYSKEYDPRDIYDKLNALIGIETFDMPWKGILAENLNGIGKRKDAIDYVDTIVDKKTISDLLHFYIRLLFEQLVDRNDNEQGRYKELMELLKFWRTNSYVPDEQLLQIEHDLYSEINDLANLEEVSSFLYKKFPANELYILAYLNILVTRREKEKLINISSKIPTEYNNEKIGVNVSNILVRNGIKDKGFDIIFRLATDPGNKIARMAYFTNSMMCQEFFERYDEVRLNSWVTYSIEGKLQKQFVKQRDGLQGELLGKKLGGIFVKQTNLSNKIVTLEIIGISNNATNLLDEISEEAKNPINELGIQSMDLPLDINKMEEELISQFGVAGSQEKESKDQYLQDYYNYRIGFSEVVRGVFKGNHIDAYFHLTNYIGCKFTTLPNRSTADLNVHENTEFILDFSTLILFYKLDKEHGFIPKHTFRISSFVRREIENEITELQHSPESFINLQITMDGVRRGFVAENHKQKRSGFLQSLIEWVDANCVVDLVEEKLETAFKLRHNQKLNGEDSFSKWIDYMHFSSRAGSRLISSDSTIFLFKAKGNFYNNIINPEKYLVTYFPEKINTDFYRTLLKSNYLGISINLDTLKNEFYDFLSGKENYYLGCIENLQFTIHRNPNMIGVASKFLKEIFTSNFLRPEDRSRHALEIVRSITYGMPPDFFQDFLNLVKQEFKQMGNMYDQIIGIFYYLLRVSEKR